jgi:HAD superfamily hydrolase (TIGR01459 family)
MRPITRLSDLADRYDALLCDIWGVIHNGREAFPDACAALARWRAEVGPVILISNAPRPKSEIFPQLAALGAPATAWTDIVTSGDVTRTELQRRAPGPAWRIGPERDAPLYAGIDLPEADLETARFISCTGPFDDDVETAEDYRERFIRAVARGLPMVCANPDIVVQRGDRLIPCGGALAALYAELGGEVLMAGKPYAPIYDAAIGLAREAKPDLQRDRVLCIGDGVVTDVRGANAQDLDVLYVAGGIAGADLLMADGTLDLAAAERLLLIDGGRADYIIPALV